jgi:hypothetical protein
MRSLYLGSAAALVMIWSGPAAAAAESTQNLEVRVQQLEAALAEVKAELAATRSAAQAQGDQILRIETRPTPPPAPAPMLADGFRIGPTTVKYGGYVKLDAMVSSYDGNPANSDLVRDFLLPGSIPVGGAGSRETHFSARQTRLWFTTDATLSGHKVGSRVEFDFQALPGTGDQRTTSPSNLALRRAYFTVDDWLFGQEWSAFQNTAVLPETADYIGPSEGTVFVRQAQVRYHRGPFTVSLENPESTITPRGGGTRIVADDSAWPDAVVRLDLKRPYGEFALAGLVRDLAYKDAGVKARATGWGVTASAKLNIGKRDDLRMMITHGEGIGRYVGVNLTNDAVIDASGDLHPIGLTAGFAAYRHMWTPTLRSTLIYSAQTIDNPVTLTGGAANSSAESVHLNVVWSPAKSIDLGVEAIRGRRELESGAQGDLNRLAAFAKYGF